jgi:predicted ArsR family transcriptional regulator
MERLPVFKALGDNTRYAIYLELARAATPLSTAEIADALELHPNTVRPHLERMRDAGLLSVDTDRQGQVGRPQHLYSVAPDAPSLGLEPSAFRLLARLVADVAARAGLDSDEVAAVGQEHGRSMALACRSAASASAADAVRDGLADLGFDPATATDAKVTTIAFTRCPFQELAEVFPEVVCHLHRGIVEGIVEATGGARVTRFATLEDRDPCEVDLVRS